MSEGGAGLRASLSPLYLLRFACMCGERQGEREGTKEARERDNGDGEPAPCRRTKGSAASPFVLQPRAGPLLLRDVNGTMDYTAALVAYTWLHPFRTAACVSSLLISS